MTYSLLIVEDEPLEAELLEDVIRKKYPEITRIYQADNGIDALRLTQKKNPDIVMLDINIPGITGIDYMREISQNHFPGQVIITTAYDSFDYARETMRYGAAGYLLKPIMDAELFEYMKKCFALIQENKKHRQISEGMESICSYAQTYLFHDFLKGKIPEQAMKKAYGWSENGILQARILRIIFPENSSITMKKETAEGIRETFQPFFRMIQMAEEGELLCMFQPCEKCEEAMLETAVWCAASGLVRLLEKTVKEELIGMQILFTKNCMTYQELREELPNASCFRAELDFGDVSSYERRIKMSKALCRMKEGNARRAVNVFHTMFENPKTRWAGVYLFLKAVLQYDGNADIMDGFLATNEQKIPESLELWLGEILVEPENCPDSIHPVIAEAVKIMEAEYGSLELSQASLAERMGLNQAYFSRRFKKETGEKFSTMMTRIRMEHAKELLDQGVSVEQAVSETGYLNKRYFSEMYKLYFGISVSQYISQERQKKK